MGLALGIQAFLIKPYQIPSASMVPTLEVGQRVLVNRLVYRFRDPAVGDVVVFHPPAGATNGKGCGTSRQAAQPCPRGTSEESEQNFIKRIVAGPGDTLEIEDGHPVVNGEKADEPFAQPCRSSGSPCDLPQEITIPPDQYFMMGDNRDASDDSRSWGPVPRDQIIGGAFFTYWPIDRVGIL